MKDPRIFGCTVWMYAAKRKIQNAPIKPRLTSASKRLEGYLQMSAGLPFYR